MNPDSSLKTDGNWWPAPAKLNLFLHITGRRPDGYHELQTLFQILDWGDRVYLEKTNDGEVQRINAEYDVPEDEDLVIRAARLLKRVSNSRFGAAIEVHKQIPIGSGLGGGSTDAATVLVALNHLWGCNHSAQFLADLGLELGADVPVFVHGHTAMATGVGENLVPVLLGERHYLLVMPGFSVSTAEVFNDTQLKRDSGLITAEQALAGDGRNDCEPVSKRLHPALAELFDELSEYGQPRMSGTGSSVFVEMPSRSAASSAAATLKCRYNVAAVGGLDQSPLQQMTSQSDAGKV